MVDFKQYPHVISSESETDPAEPSQDGNGDWVIPAPGDMATISTQGRAVPNGKQNKVASQDGQMVDFSFMIYMPQDAPDFITGQVVTIMDGSNQIGTGTVKRFFRGQLNATMWV